MNMLEEAAGRQSGTCQTETAAGGHRRDRVATALHLADVRTQSCD